MATQRICTIPGCGKARKGATYCGMHAARLRRFGRLHNIRVPDRKCSVAGCDGEHRARGYCEAHYRRSIRKTRKTSRVYAFKGEGQRFLQSLVGTQEPNCVPWPFSLRDGYGQTTYKGKGLRASRLVCILAHGAPQGAANEAAHSCGNPICVNPNHIRWATEWENAQDRIAHGRQRRGETIPFSKLTNETVLKIRASTVPSRQLSKQFGVAYSTIDSVRNRRTWKHI